MSYRWSPPVQVKLTYLTGASLTGKTSHTMQGATFK